MCCSSTLRAIKLPTFIVAVVVVRNEQSPPFCQVTLYLHFFPYRPDEDRIVRTAAVGLKLFISARSYYLNIRLGVL